MKKILLLIVATALAFTSNAQLGKTDDVKKSLASENKDTVAWLYKGVFNLGVNQGFLHNWAAGGELASLTINGLFSGNLTRLYHKSVWSNNLDLNYGLIYANSTHFVPQKTDDRIDFTSKFGSRIDTSNFFITGLFNFKSQFSKGYDYTVPNWDSFPTSQFLSPAYLTLAAGVEYRKGAALSLFLSPIAGRVTLAKKYYTMMKPEGAYGVEYGKTSRFEFGAYFSGRYVVNITKSMTFKTRLDLFTNYLAKDVKDSTGTVVVKKDNPGNVDILWDNLFSWKIAKYVNLTLGGTFIYDNDLPYSKTYVNSAGATVLKDEPGTGLGWWQVKQIFTLGFEYKF